MSRKIQITFLLFIFVTFVYGAFYLGNLYAKSKAPICPPQDLDFSLFWEAYYKLKDNFIDKEKILPQKILYGAISGMVKSLEDPYTEFFDPQEAKIFEEDTKGYFEGVGLEIGIKDGKLTVIAPLENTPAQRAGILPGDIILEIDGKSTLEMSLDEAVKLIRGPKGTKVKLKISREGWKDPKEFELEREVISVPSLKWEEKDGIIYLKIYQFSEKARLDFVLAADQILKLSTKKLILDLRNNPGGYLEVAVDIGSWFLEKGRLIAIEETATGEKIEYKSSGPGKFEDYKMVILINNGTASGAEILAAALKENLNVLLLGEKSFGKGSVQKIERLRDGSALKITIAKWLTPNGRQISKIGLTPDIEVKVNPEEIEQDKDPQLERALEILKNL